MKNMNNIVAASLDINALPKFSELFPNMVTPRELVRFPGNPISEGHYPCPAPTTPNVAIIEDIGRHTLIFIQKGSQRHIVPRVNEAVPAPLAYLITKRSRQTVFQCVFEVDGQAYLNLGVLPDADFEFWETFAENVGTASARLSPLGIDLLMRYATSSEDPAIAMDLVAATAGGERYEGFVEGMEIDLRRSNSPEGDCWTVGIGASPVLNLITHRNKLGR